MSSTKHQHLYERLREEIVSGRLRPGQMLPKQTELMSKHAVALGTVRQALTRLQQERFTRALPGKGTFVCDPADRAEPIVRGSAIAMVCVHPVGPVTAHSPRPDPIIEDQVLNLQRAIREHNHELVVHMFDQDQPGAIGRWCRQFAGVVIYGKTTQAILRAILEHEIPVCAIGDVEEGACPAGASQVMTDLGSGMELAIDYLHGLGHARVVFLNRGSTNANKVLSDSFLRAMDDGRLSRESRELIVATPEQEEQFCAQLPGMDPQPTVILAFGGMLACRLIHKLERVDYRVPQRIGVMALNNIEAIRLSEPGLCRVNFDMAQAVRHAAEILQEQIETGKSVRQMVTPRLYAGTTCGASGVSSGASAADASIHRHKEQR